MEVRTALLYNGLCEPAERPVRISSVPIKNVSEWQWYIKGEYELVDEGHHSKEEATWLVWLRLNARKGLHKRKLVRHRKTFIHSMQITWHTFEVSSTYEEPNLRPEWAGSSVVLCKYVKMVDTHLPITSPILHTWSV